MKSVLGSLSLPGVGRIFGLTYTGYALLYLVRKPFGVVKSGLKAKMQLSTATLAGVDMSFLLSYTLSNLGVGYMEDALGTHSTLVVAFLGSALATAGFACTDQAAIWMLCWILQGTCQAWVYPLCAKLVSSQFSESVRNSVWGVWVTCQHVGGMLGTLIAAEISKKVGWRAAFWIPSFWVLLAAVCLRLFLPVLPNTKSAAARKPSEGGSQTKISLREAIRIPFIKGLGIGYFCIKLVRYVGVLWLPFFLSDLGFKEDEAAFISIAFDVGGVLGGTACGVLADLVFGGRLLLIILGMCGAASITCLAYMVLHPALGQFGHAAVLFALGIMVAGPDANFGGAACMSAVERSAAPKEFASTASGFVNSMGALGTVFTGVLVTAARGSSSNGGAGWSRLWLALTVLCAAPCAALLPATLAEHKYLKLKQRHSVTPGDSGTMVGKPAGNAETAAGLFPEEEEDKEKSPFIA